MVDCHRFSRRNRSHTPLAAVPCPPSTHWSTDLSVPVMHKSFFSSTVIGWSVSVLKNLESANLNPSLPGSHCNHNTTHEKISCTLAIPSSYHSPSWTRSIATDFNFDRLKSREQQPLVCYQHLKMTCTKFATKDLKLQSQSSVHRPLSSPSKPWTSRASPPRSRCTSWTGQRRYGTRRVGCDLSLSLL